MLAYRIGNYFYNRNIPVIPFLCDVYIRVVHNSVVYSCSTIGKGTTFSYGGIAVIVHKKAVIGNDCVIGGHVTIGGKSKMVGVPVIGNRVYVATGAKILGEVVVGDDCVIGANAVVVDDVPTGSIAAGVPAKVIKSQILSKDYY